MKNTSFKLAVVVAVLYSAFAAFMLAKTIDESTIPGSSILTVSSDTVTTGEAGLSALATDIVHDADSVLVRETRDLHDPTKKHYYVTAAPERAESAWIAEGYPSFSRAETIVVHPNGDLDGLDPRGRYYILGNPSATASARSTFEQLGYTVEQSDPSSFAAYATWLVSGQFGSATLITVTLIALLIVAGIITRSKSYAVQRLHGMTAAQSRRQDLRQLLPSLTVTIASIASISSLALWRYNGLHGFDRYLSTAALTLAGILIAGTAAYLSAHRLVWNQRLLEGLKGRLGFRVTAPTAYLIRVPGIILTIAVLASTITTTSLLSAAEEAREKMSRAADAATIVYDGHVSPEQMDTFAIQTGEWLRGEDSANRMILAAPLNLDGSDHETLLVNNAYLTANPIYDPAGRRVADLEPDSVTILIPDGLQTGNGEIVDRVQSSFTPTKDFSDTFQTRTIRPQQDTYLYEPTPEPPSRPEFLNNAVIIVANSESRFIRDDDYMALSSQGRVLVTDVQAALANVPDQLMGVWISAFVPVAQEAATTISELSTQLRIILGTLIVCIVVLLTTAIGLAQIHVRGNAQSIFVRYVHGWKFRSIHRWLFTTEVVVSAGAFFWTLLAMVVTLASSPESLAPRGSDLMAAQLEPWIVLGLAILNVATLAVLVHLRSQRLLQTHSQETV